MKLKLKVGDVLVAKAECIMTEPPHKGKSCLTIGHIYQIYYVNEDKKIFRIKSNLFECHEFGFSDIDQYFTIKPKKKETVKVESKVDDIQVGDEYVGNVSSSTFVINRISPEKDMFELESVHGDRSWRERKTLNENFTKKPNPAPIKVEEGFYMVVVEGSICPPTEKHNDYDYALGEASRLSKKENKTAYVVQAITKVEQVVNVKQLKK